MKQILNVILKRSANGIIFTNLNQKYFSFFSQNGLNNLEKGLNSKKLDNFEIDSVAKYLETCKNIVFINGAGISTCNFMHKF